MTNKTTVKVTGKRTWEGPIENYEAHSAVIEHWCGGGEAH